jgi:hypothetical protein
VTVNTGSGKTAGTQIESLDFGAPDSTGCSGITALHAEYWNLSNGSDRSQTVSITTTITGYFGYEAEVCYFTSQPFTVLELTAGTPEPCSSAPQNGECLAPAYATTIGGTPGYEGLLAFCGTKPLAPLTVDCNKNPGVTQLGTSNGDGTVTSVIQVPPGFDARTIQ